MTDLNLLDGPTVDIKALSPDELMTVYHIASIVGRGMLPDEVEAVRRNPDDALGLVDPDTISERLNALMRRETNWAELSPERCAAGLAFAYALTRESTAAMFARLHQHLSGNRARRQAAAV